MLYKLTYNPISLVIMGALTLTEWNLADPLFVTRYLMMYERRAKAVPFRPRLWHQRLHWLYCLQRAESVIRDPRHEWNSIMIG